MGTNNKDNQSPLQKAIQNNRCHTCREIRKRPDCVCGPAGDGGGKSGKGGSGKDHKPDVKTGHRKDKPTMTPDHLLTSGNRKADASYQYLMDALVLALLNGRLKYQSGLLLVECDPALGKLMIEGIPNLNKAELASVRAFLKDLKEAYQAFAKETKGFKGQIKDNGYGVTILIADKKQFADFIQYLHRQQLLPRPMPGSTQKARLEDELKDKSVARTPFASIHTGPKIKSSKI